MGFILEQALFITLTWRWSTILMVSLFHLALFHPSSQSSVQLTLYHCITFVTLSWPILPAFGTMHLTPFSTFLLESSSDWHDIISTPCLKPSLTLPTGKSTNELQACLVLLLYFSLLQLPPWILQNITQDSLLLTSPGRAGPLFFGSLPQLGPGVAMIYLHFSPPY